MNRFQLYFFSVLFIGVLVLTGMVMWPFVNVIAISLILAMLVRPAYRKLVNKKVPRNIASALIVLGVIILVVVPLGFLISELVEQSLSVSASGFEYVKQLTEHANGVLTRFVPDFELDVEGIAKQSVVWIGERLGTVFSSTAHTVFQFILGIIALFFFIRDGEKFRETLINLSPLSDGSDREIIGRLRQTVHAVIVGSIAVGIAQGLLVGIGLFIFGVPNAILWGAIACISAFIPGIGTGLVILPAIVYLYFQTGGFIYPLGLLTWGVVLVGLVDNVLIPYFYGRGQQIHALIILFSVLGGLLMFGPIGFLYGPLVVSLFFALLHIYKQIPAVEEQKK
ncbi:MAG: AI-2E family transporter [Candidatus Paceibacterota bacterium]